MHFVVDIANSDFCEHIHYTLYTDEKDSGRQGVASPCYVQAMLDANKGEAPWEYDLAETGCMRARMKAECVAGYMLLSLACMNILYCTCVVCGVRATNIRACMCVLVNMCATHRLSTGNAFSVTRHTFKKNTHTHVYISTHYSYCAALPILA